MQEKRLQDIDLIRAKQRQRSPEENPGMSISVDENNRSKRGGSENQSR